MRLIDADKLIRKLKWLSTQRWLEHAKSNASGMLNDVQDVVNMQPTFDPWHYPSKGELPTENGWYWVTLEDRGVVVQEKKYFDCITKEFSTVFKVQAWMALPEPPKEIKK